MKTTKIAVTLLFFLYSNFANSQIDSTAVQIVQKSLNTVKGYIEGNKNINGSLAGRAVVFLFQLTGIASENGGSFIGPNAPSLKDYEKWEKWLYTNMENIRWQKDRQIILIKKEVKVLAENVPSS